MNVYKITNAFDINLKINNDNIFYFLMCVVHRKLCIINKEDVINNYLLLNYFKSALNTTSIKNINTTDELENNLSIKNNKYYILKTRILSSSLLKKEDKEYIISLFNKTQKIYFALLTYIKLCKTKKYIIYTIDTDFRFNKLNIYDTKRIVKIYENKTIYRFYIFDLLKYWKTLLLNSEYLYEDPLTLKNPYTNLIISKINLYNIYFNALCNNIMIPSEVIWFYKCDFDIELFKLYHGLYLKEYAITSFVETEDLELYNDLLNIKHNYPNITNKIILIYDIDNNIKKQIIHKMLPILECYYITRYTNNSYKEKYYHNKFLNLLEIFNTENSGFGRKIYKKIDGKFILQYNIF